MRRLLVVPALVLATVLASAAPAPAATSKTCETFDRFLRALVVTDLGCPKARQVMNGWARSRRCIPDGDGILAERVNPCTVRRFRCTPRKGEGGVTVRCRKGSSRIRFFATGG